ncbi:MAG TPA: Uma2 family endonuclease [Mycobacteriales bacterium]|nr:Uma2 family endonuclease [Mycobacteriales bacterium]
MSCSVDRVLKRELYEQSGVLAYWVVDPLARTVSVWTLTDGAYGEPLVVAGTDRLDVEVPFTLTLVPAELGG